MSWIPLALAQRSNPSRFGFEGAARLVNCYSEKTDTDAKNDRAIYAVPGLDPWITPADGATYCLLATETRLYGVTGLTVWSIDTSDVVTVIDTLPIEGACYMARNRRSPTTEIGLVTAADGKYYVITGTTMALVTDPDLQGTPSSIDVRDGYFIIPSTFNRFFITGEDNATSVAALDYGKAQRSPDEISRVISTESEIVLFGDKSTEWHQNSPSGSGGFPFVPVANIELGLLAPGAVVRLDRSVVWVASDGTVRLMNGYGGQIISTPSVQRSIGSLTDTSEIIAFAWHQRDIGHSFVALTSSSWAWIYDLNEGLWHERQSYGLDRWRGRAAVEWNGRTLIGDYVNGTLYTVSGSVNSEAGDPMIMTVQAPPLNAHPNALQIHAVALDVIPGQGIATAPAAHDRDPKVMMSYSDDGGRTWSTERTADLGQQGAVNARARWHRLGIIRRNGRTFRFSISASVARGFQSASVDVEKLAV